jgi:type III secretion protein Q
MPLPFELPTCSRGYSLLTPAVRQLGVEVAAAASGALTTLVGGEVAVSGRALPAVPSVGAGAAMLRLELGALPASAWIELDARLAVAFLDRLCGGPGEGAVAVRPTPLEEAALELAALACLDAVASLPVVAERLAPRLVRGASGPPEGLAIELKVRLGATEGRGLFSLPGAAVRALGEGGDPGDASAHALVDLSIRSGFAPLAPAELADLAPGDVVLFDPVLGGRLEAVAPGGLRVRGADAGGSLHVQEILMSDPISEHPVALEVELARIPITLGELVRLEVDAILPLPIDRSGSVTLRLGDRTFARGRLVDVEGVVGVRIDSLAGADR